MESVSVIVPVYHGKRYIKDLIKQVESAQKILEKDNFVELILVNDAPDDPLEEVYVSDFVEIVVMNSDYNGGIHDARVRGEKKSRGEYVIFLDQDDKIDTRYLRSQLECIGNADAIVCRCIHEKMQYYNATLVFEQMISKEYMLSEGCPIISPGQVLLRKSSIPAVWKNNIMHTNCADDFLLWLCMVGEGRQFALNQEILFEHVVEYNNASWDSFRMTYSEHEMAQILISNNVFSEKDVILFNQMLRNIKKKRMEKLDKFRKMFYILNDWTMLDKTGSGLERYLIKHGYKNIAIYGVGYLGKHLMWEFSDSDIRIQYAIDRNAAWIQERCPVYTLDDQLQCVDAVIVTLVQGEEHIVNELKMKTGATVFTIRELVRLASEGNGI